MEILPPLSEFSKRRMLFTQRPPAIAPSPTQMPGPTTMQYIYPALYTLSLRQSSQQSMPTSTETSETSNTP